MKKTKILLVCAMGLNRSKYLAKYLKNKGYSTRFGGVGHGKIDLHAHNPFTQEDVDWCDLIITARKKHGPLIKKKFKTKGKKIIQLDVTDSRRMVIPDHPELDNLDYETFQRRWTYPKLRKAIRPYLPLKP